MRDWGKGHLEHKKVDRKKWLKGGVAEFVLGRLATHGVVFVVLLGLRGRWREGDWSGRGVIT